MLDAVGPIAAAEPISANTWTPHGIVLRDTWFPLAHSDAVGERPVRRAVHSQPYILWRENGRPIASEFHPDDRGKKEAGFLTGGTGRYPVIEKYGYVWGWYGDPAKADEVYLPNVPYLPPNGGVPKHMRGTNRFECTAALSIENLIDLTHSDFLHANVVGDEKSESENVEVFSTSETVTMVRTCVGKSVAPIMRRLGGVKSPTQEVRQVIHVYLRSHVCLAYGRFRPGHDVPLFHPCVPETRDRTRLDYTMNTVNSKGFFRYAMPKASFVISRQDAKMTTPQSERYEQATRRRDLHSRFDVPGQRYRVLLQELARRQAGGDYSYGTDVNVSDDVSDIIGIEPGLFKYN